MKDFLKLLVFVGLFAVPFLTLYVENDYFFPFITGKNFWFRIIVDVVFAAWVVLALYEAQYRPKVSGILYGFAAFLGVMFFANLLGEHQSSSFWSNFERMDGYVSLVHTFLYMLVLSSVLTKREHWVYLLNTSLGVATLVALVGFSQYLDSERIPQIFSATVGGNRVDSTLGNAAYMAIYMLFHIFMVFWLFINTKKTWLRALYAALVLFFVFVLFETGTRGTVLGLATGVMVMSAYIGLFGAKFKEFRKIAIGGFVLLVVVVTAFIAARDSSFIQEQKNLARIANISISDLSTRGTIWGMAWNGVEERPVLGWGQSNFNYVFNEQYEPSLYAQEQWFDRAHNIFFDWLIAGGFLGLLTYLSIFVACVYYLFWRPWRSKDDSFTVLERGVLLGLLAGYFTHNFVVFDNIISYIFFAITLGLIHGRIGAPVPALEKLKVDKAIVTQAALPVMVVAVILVIVFVHRPGMAAAGDIIDALRSQDPQTRLAEMQEAIDRDSFGHQEITEQLAQQTISITGNPNISSEVKTEFRQATEAQLDRLVAEKPGDARVHVFVASYFRAVGDLDRAAEEMKTARELSPEKPSIIIQQGFIELARGDNQAAKDFLETAFELEPRNIEAREYYAASLFYVGKQASATDLLIDDERVINRFANSDFLLGAANQSQANEFLTQLFTFRVDQNPTDPQNWASLAYLQYQQGSTSASLQTLEEASNAVPGFAPTAQCFARNIEAGREPQEGC